MMVRYADPMEGTSPTMVRYAGVGAEEYAAQIASRLESAFDLGHEWLGAEYDLTAVFRCRMEQTALLRDNVMDWSNTTEVVLMSAAEGTEDVKAALEELKAITLQSSKPDRHHRLTTVVRVIAGYRWGKNEAALVKRYRFSRSFRLGFYGWCTAAAVLVDLSNGEVVTNWAGRGRKKYFLPVTVYSNG